MRPIDLQFGRYTSSVIELKGGINENASSLELQAGELIECKNYMIAEGGYGGLISTAGYERTDGRTLPSEYESHVLTITDAVGVILEGSTVSGDTSGSTSTALSDSVLISGSYGVDAVIKVEVRDRTVPFIIGEIVEDDGVAAGTYTATQVVIGGTEDFHAGVEYARGLIQPVPGEGPILGVNLFKSDIYAMRKREGLNQIGIFKETPTGWVELTQTVQLAYTSGHRFVFTNYNFSATDGSYYMYFCDGQNQARYYNGTTVEIVDNVGMPGIDKPTRIKAHNNRLFLAYRGGSLQCSTLGDPLDWTTAPVEFGLGNEITDITVGVGSTLVIHLTKGIRILHGSTEDTFEMQTFSEDTGGYPYTTKRLTGTILFITDKGLTTLNAVESFGDYADNTISQRFKRTLVRDQELITAALTHRGLNQYRLYFSNNRAIYVSFQGKDFVGATFLEFPNPVVIAAQGDNEQGHDCLVFADGTSNGLIFRLDSGNTFDGTVIITRLATAFYHNKTPRLWKRYKRATIEVQADSGQVFNIRAQFDYNEPDSKKSIWYAPSVYKLSGAAIWGEGVWGTMVYGEGNPATSRLPVYISGVGTNVSYRVVTNMPYKGQHTIQNIITDYEQLSRRV